MTSRHDALRTDKKAREDQERFTALVSLHVQGKIEEAARGYKALVESRTPIAAAYSNLAAIELNNGRAQAAIDLLQQAIARDPNLPQAYFSLGNAYHGQGRTAESVTAYQQAVRLNPDFADAHYNLAVTLGALGKLDDAIQSYRAVVRLHPQFADAHSNLGAALKDSGNLDEAIASCRQATRLQPNNYQAYLNLGVALKKQGALQDAIASYQDAIRIKPDYHPAFFNLGIAFAEQGHLEEAATAYRQAAALKPDDPNIHLNLGTVLFDNGKFADAEIAYRRAIALRPDHAPTYRNLGNALRKLAKRDDAIAAYKRCLELNVDDVDALIGLGITYCDQGLAEPAFPHLERAVALAPSSYRAHQGMGIAYNTQGRLGEAGAAYQRAIAIKPDADSYSNLIYTSSFGQLFAQEELLEMTRKFEALFCQPAASENFPHTVIAPTAKIRIGFISAEIGHHAVAYFLESYLRHYDRETFEVTLYPTTLRNEPQRETLMSLARQTRDLSDLNDKDARQLILNDKIDILIDTTSHMRGSRMRLLSQRCAPIQCHYIGFHGSTGLSSVDYFIGDDEVTPPEFATHFSEKIHRLPRLWVAYTAPVDAPAPKLRPPSENINLGCFNTLAKVGEASLSLWSDVLKTVPKARLILKDRLCADAYTRNRILTFLSTQGVDHQRVDFIESTPSWNDHMSLYDKIDIALDTCPLNSGTTGFDALFMGTPLVAMRGDWMGGRMSSAMLRALGHPEWVADNAQDYVKIVADLASDRHRLNSYKTTLRQEVLDSPLCDGRSLAVALESAFRDMMGGYNAQHERS